VSDASTLETAKNTRFALCVEYDGSAYKGWQAQKKPAVITVQEELEAALSRVANHPIKLICAGRTDAGVHASAQIVHLDCHNERLAKAWVKGANSFLEGRISVLWAKQVKEEFHARFSAENRHYRYVIYNNSVRPALMKGLVTSCFFQLDEKLMHEGAQYLLGEHDFTSYRGVACQSKTAIRNVMALSVQRFGEYLLVDIKANAFLLHMVRNIVGVLLEIGQGRKEPQWAQEVLALKDRSCAGVTAPPDGLYLVNVGYPAVFNLPTSELGPAWLRGVGAKPLFC
jgi:tRNA pseudouridine38-40 synthase